MVNKLDRPADGSRMRKQRWTCEGVASRGPAGALRNMSLRRNYEDAPEYSAEAYTHPDFARVALRVLGWETEPDEDTYWSGHEVRTGKLLVRMVGDDQRIPVDPEDITPLERATFCGVCGQIGCRHDGMDRDE